jgi:hypothetical protein
MSMMWIRCWLAAVMLLGDADGRNQNGNVTVATTMASSSPMLHSCLTSLMKFLSEPGGKRPNFMAHMTRVRESLPHVHGLRTTSTYQYRDFILFRLFRFAVVVCV